MTSSPIEVVFGRSRLRMATGPHVEVTREAAAPGERRRYTKRFLATAAGDFRRWTAREARIVAYLAGRGVRGAPALTGSAPGSDALQTFDAGVTVEHLVTLLTLQRDGRVVPHVFADCGHWWALAHHTLRVLETLHALDVVHLDVKPDNLCVPVLPAGWTPEPGATIRPQFARLALIDFAFSLVPHEPLASPLPLGPRTTYPYQSPRLLEALAACRKGDLRPTRALDWRCDLYSVGAMLRLYLPAPGAEGWTVERHGRALALLAAVSEAHDRETAVEGAHASLIDMCEAAMDEDLVASLLQGFVLAPPDATRAVAPPSTPLTCIVSARDVGLAPSPPIAASTRDETALHAVKSTNVPVMPTPAAALEPVLEPIAVAPAVTRTRRKAPDASLHTILPAPASTSTQPAAAAPVVAGTPHPQLRVQGERREPMPPPPRRYRSHAAAAVIAISLVVAASLALIPGEPRHDATGSRDGESASKRASPPAPAPDQAVDVASVTGDARDTPERQTLALDAATAQRAAHAEGRDAPTMQGRDATGLPPPAPPPSPQTTAARSPPTRDTPTVAGAQAPSPAPSAAAPSPPARTTPSLRTRETQTATRRDVAPAPDERVQTAQPGSPAAKAFAPSRPDERAIASIPHPGVEHVVARTQRDVARVLATAAAAAPGDEERVRQVARSMRPVAGAPDVPTQSPSLARQLNDRARAAWERNDIDAALKLQQQAFRANPNDPEITGNLAFFYLKSRPVQPEVARRLAIYALAARGERFPAGRFQDWGTLAVASALAGRESDAATAMVVMLSVSGNAERACRAARMAVAQYGEPLKAPTAAMLSRVRERGDASGAPSCG